jgi:hypothetical protein
LVGWLGSLFFFLKQKEKRKKKKKEREKIQNDKMSTQVFARRARHARLELVLALVVVAAVVLAAGRADRAGVGAVAHVVLCVGGGIFDLYYYVSQYSSRILHLVTIHEMQSRHWPSAAQLAVTSVTAQHRSRQQ